MAQTVVITGGSRGIGLALAHRFHAAGDRVVLVGRDAASLANAAQDLPGATGFVADLSRPEDRARLVDAFPDVAVLVNNAGIQINVPLSQQNAADIALEVNVNLLAPILLTHAFLPTLLKQPRAAIVNVTSVLAFSPKQSASVYCASKAALHSFTRTLRWQLEGTPVRVFELVPPLVDTEMTAGRGRNKMSPQALAASFWQQYSRGRTEAYAGKAALAHWLARVAPPLAEKLLRHG
ncbi:SDR family oxidoreductase [Chitinibacteraceae bacterium HSL-7]